MIRNHWFGVCAFVGSVALLSTLVGCNQEKDKRYGSVQGVLTSIPSDAYEVRLIEVRSDRTGDKAFEFNLAIDSENRISALQYLGGPNGTQVYSIEQLEAGITLTQVSKEVGGITFTKEIVHIRSTQGFNAANGGTVELDLLREFTMNPFASDDRRSLQFDINFSGSHGAWEALYRGDRTGWRAFDGLYFKQRVVGGEAKGIESVLFSQGGEAIDQVETGDLKQE